MLNIKKVILNMLYFINFQQIFVAVNINSLFIFPQNVLLILIYKLKIVFKYKK
jgi:hypothetical protein